MRSPAILISIILITAGITFPQGTLNPGTATDLQRLDMIGSTRIDQLMKSAAAGNAESQLRLGLAYQNGVDAVSGEQVGRNLAEAAKWFRAAADQGNVNAQFKIGNVLLNGDGVRRNYAEAAMWFRKAAEIKHAGAQAFLGKHGVDLLEGSGRASESDTGSYVGGARRPIRKGPRRNRSR